MKRIVWMLAPVVARARATHSALAPCGSDEKMSCALASGASSVATNVTAPPGSSNVSPR